MPRFSLIPHPAFPPHGVRAVTAAATFADDAVSIDYRVMGSEHVSFPAAGTPVRTDGLWRTTCFELFATSGDGPAYLEFNFAPSRQWAAYRFAGYRAGGADLACDVPEIVQHADGVSITVRSADLAMADRFALTAVIEEASGIKSYWALRHGDGAPDFHDPDCFIARRAAPGAA